MTKIKIFKNADGKIVRYEVSGHSGYDSYGRDIVCAAISILAQTALNSLNEVCGIEEKYICYTLIEEQGYLDVSLSENLSKELLEKAEIVLETMLVGFKGLQDVYPKYITLEYGEV